MTPFNLVFHIDELEKWPRVMANVNNLIKGLDEPYDIRIVANGAAVKGYLAAEYVSAFVDLTALGVTLNICQNSMNGFEMSPSMLLSCITIVPAAVITLARLQHQGFAYIKP